MFLPWSPLGGPGVTATAGVAGSAFFWRCRFALGFALDLAFGFASECKNAQFAPHLQLPLAKWWQGRLAASGGKFVVGGVAAGAVGAGAAGGLALALALDFALAFAFAFALPFPLPFPVPFSAGAAGLSAVSLLTFL